MKVRELQDILKDAKPDSEVVIPGRDHSYNTTCGEITLAEKVGYDEYYEYYEDDKDHIDIVEEVVVIS